MTRILPPSFMWNKPLPFYLFVIMALLPGFVACSRQDVCEEKMRALEGKYLFYGAQNIHPEDDPYTAQILKTGDHWVFSFSLPIKLEDGSQTLYQFEQRVSWSPEMKNYLFEHLSESDYERLGVDFVVTQFNRYWIYMMKKKRSETGISVVEKITWEKQ